MIICLDVGNTNIFGGVFIDEKLLLRFRLANDLTQTSDQFGVFFRNVLHENNINPAEITDIIICSVVPPIEYSLRAACIKYFNITPFFLQPNVKTGLQVHRCDPAEIGADRIANAIAATQYYPNKNIIVIDMGTATTFCAISKTKEYLGGAILAGIKLSMNALSSNTAKLFPVEIIKPKNAIGCNTEENIQSGLYYGQLGIIRELTQRMTEESFTNDPPIILGTGGFSYLFENESLFTAIIPDLILQGLRQVFLLNQ